MTELPNEVHRLTENWATVVKVQGKYLAQDFPPLLDMLQNLVTPNTGRTVGGANDPATRSVIDLKALDLLMEIQDIVRSRLNEWGITSARDLKADALGFHTRLDALWRATTITEGDYLRLSAYPVTWAQRIWDLIEPPLQLPLKEATCPKCNRAKWINENEEHVDNLLVSFREGGDVQAECRWKSCDGLWYGAKALRELGFHVGATVDDDALREMGIDV